MNTKNTRLNWYKVAEPGELPEGRVKTVTAGIHSMALTHIEDAYYAMDNRCPHQGGPLGEGSIETGTAGECLLRCPWHGWDFDPKTGLPPGGHEDTGATNVSRGVPRGRHLCSHRIRYAARGDSY